MNINLAINEGIKILNSKFIPNPLLDAEILMAKTINKDRNYILLNSSDTVNENNLSFLLELVMSKTQSFHQKLHLREIPLICEVSNLFYDL